MRAALLLVGVLASVVNAYYYEVDVMANNKDQWMKCVNPNTFDFKGIDPSTGKHWDGIGGPCLSFLGKDPNRVLVFPNSDWRLNQFYNVSITPGEIYNHVPSLKTQETGLVIPCTLADEYHALAGTPEDQMPYRFPNHWLYVCTAPELFRNRTELVVPTTTTTTATTVPVTTIVPVITTVQANTTALQTTTVVLPVTTTVTTITTKEFPQPSATCSAGYRGKRTGKGPNGACCSHSDDCKESCVKGVCKVFV